MAKPISPAQIKFMNDLVEKRDMSGLSEDEQAFLRTPAAWPNMNSSQAHKAITKLLECPKKPAQVHRANDPDPVRGFDPGAPVPDAGYYFILDPTNKTSEYPEGKESFFRVKKGTDRWEGYTFLSAQASDDWYAIKDADRRQKIYDAILVDPINAMNEYGIRLGVCGNCGRTLTDRDSRLRGMGPVCAERILGRPTEQDLEVLKQLGLM